MFFLFISQQTRVQNKNNAITEGYILLVIQYIEIDSSCTGVSNRDKIFLYPLKAKKDSPAYSFVRRFCVIFNRFYFCSADLFLALYHIKSYSTDFEGPLIQFLFHCLNTLLNNLRQVGSCVNFTRIYIWLSQYVLNNIW